MVKSKRFAHTENIECSKLKQSGAFVMTPRKNFGRMLSFTESYQAITMKTPGDLFCVPCHHIPHPILPLAKVRKVHGNPRQMNTSLN